MNIAQIYAYLTRTRRDLWASLYAQPDETLSRPLLNGDRFHSIKDLVFHIPDVEDGWTNGDIRRTTPVQHGFPDILNVPEGPNFHTLPLSRLLEYWLAVEQSTLAWLPTLTPAELARIVEDGKSTEGLLWHVMIHEMRHTAQIVTLLRQQGVKPPSLDLLFYLPIEA